MSTPEQPEVRFEWATEIQMPDGRTLVTEAGSTLGLAEYRVKVHTDAGRPSRLLCRQIVTGPWESAVDAFGLDRAEVLAWLHRTTRVDRPRASAPDTPERLWARARRKDEGDTR